MPISGSGQVSRAVISGAVSTMRRSCAAPSGGDITQLRNKGVRTTGEHIIEVSFGVGRHSNSHPATFADPSRSGSISRLRPGTVAIVIASIIE